MLLIFLILSWFVLYFILIIQSRSLPANCLLRKRPSICLKGLQQSRVQGIERGVISVLTIYILNCSNIIRLNIQSPKSFVNSKNGLKLLLFRLGRICWKFLSLLKRVVKKSLLSAICFYHLKLSLICSNLMVLPDGIKFIYHQIKVKERIRVNCMNSFLPNMGFQVMKS